MHRIRLAVVLLPALATGGFMACAFPWDTHDANLSACEQAGYCPPPEAGADSTTDVIAADSPPHETSADSPASDREAPDASDASDAPNPTDGDAGGCTTPKTLDCDGSCVDPTTTANCGSCGNVCAGPDGGVGEGVCTGGVCKVLCAEAGTTLACGSSCVDPSQPAHCGSCTNVCPGPAMGTGTAICSVVDAGVGLCSVDCSDAGTTQLCSGSCYAPNDVHHCGSCGNDCPPPPHGNGTASCPMPGTCGVQCTSGYHACMGDCLPNSDTPSVTSDPCILSETYGIFVSPAGSDTAAGTRLAPVATLGHGIDLAKAAGKRVYACATAGSYTENLVVGTSRDGVQVYAGLDCTTSPAQWTYSVADKAMLAPASGYALALQTLSTGTSFTDFGFAATAAAGAGSSSIAVFASNAAGVVFTRCSVQAGAGAAGADATQPAPFGAAAPTGNLGTLTAGGGPTANNACPTSIGGAGGAPAATGSDGSDGQPGTSNKGTATGCATTTTGGSTGAAGMPGGASAGAASWASLTASGWTPTPGQTGQAGTVGQGGGGGGSVDLTGGGGAGGAGGCGGAGGPGGGGGGSSIAVLLFDTTIDLEACALTAGNAGAGGAGAAGQTGQTGGSHGNGFVGSNACPGGKGGLGGNGGQGGGGAGGVSAGVIWIGTAPTINGASTPSATTLTGVTFGTAGAAGTGGSPSAMAGAGAAVVQLP
jgi:hypothetical protein